MKYISSPIPNMTWKSSLPTTSAPSSSSWISVPVGKAITAVVMLVTVLIAIFLPIVIFGKLNLSKQRNSFRDKVQLWVARLSCFAAGVFLSTGFLDIFPDVIKSIDSAGKKLNLNLWFPLASFFTLIGFFLILSIEQLILIYKAHLATISSGSLKNKKRISPIFEEESQEAFLTEISDVNDNISFEKQVGQEMNKNRSTDSDLMDHRHFHENSNEDFNDNETESDEIRNILHLNKSRIFALMSAMSLHAVFEGLAVGLGTTISGILQLFIALSMHKLIIAASLGLNLATVELKLWIRITIAMIFACASPVGIGLGVLIMSQEKGHSILFLVGGILEGIACGTFLYVVFFEILPHELGHSAHKDRGWKLTCVLLGFIFVCIYILLVPSD